MRINKALKVMLYVLCTAAPFVYVLASEDSVLRAKEVRRVRIVPAAGGVTENYFPNVVLRTHEGKEVRFYDDLLKDKSVVINFMYAKCEGICPGTTSNLLKVQERLGDIVGKDIFMYSITLKPEQDTPEALAEYVAMHRVKPGWTFLTGAPEDIELLRRKLGFTDPDPEVDANKNSHMGMVLYGNEAQQQWGACPCLSDPEVMVHQILWMIPKEKLPEHLRHLSWGNPPIAQNDPAHHHHHHDAPAQSGTPSQPSQMPPAATPERAMATITQ